MTKELRLTDEQYLRVLRKMKVTIAQDGFGVECSDCTVSGYKSTDSNCGFCNGEYADKDMVLFPDQFPERRSMKYRRENHRCPFDMRDGSEMLSWGYGCFFECYLFSCLGKRDWNLSLMREMVDHALEVARKLDGS